MGELLIDGAHGEGGGQLARLAMALAAITGRSIRLVNIRARRAKSGLAPQHLTALSAVAALCDGCLEGAAIGASEVRFQPGRIRGGTYRFEVGTAGSVTLVLQAVLPVALCADVPSRVTLVGGTDVTRAPPVDYLRWVFLPWLATLGGRVEIVSLRHGYYPRGGGELTLDIMPGRHLRPLIAESAGPVRRIGGRAHVAHLPRHIAERMAQAARSGLTELAPVDIAIEVLGDTEAFGTGGALTLVAETVHGRLGSAVVAQRGVAAERLGHEAARTLAQDIATGAAVDVHAADQLLIYAAMAGQESRFSVRAVSPHAETAMWLIEQFLPVRFTQMRLDGRVMIGVQAGG